MKIVLVTGGFDPLHSGHVAYFNAAKKLGDKLIVGVNSDAWLGRKKGRCFMPITERINIVENIKSVDSVILFNDDDGSAKEAIRNVRQLYPEATILFANGGDRTVANIPEMDSGVDNVEFAFGVGGEDKKNSSSWILEEWKAPKTPRSWGYYRVLHDVPGLKVKELVVDPGCNLSMQKHFKRAEYWIVSHGSAIVNSKSDNGYAFPPKLLEVHDTHNVGVSDWHQLRNPFNEPCKIVEIQYGEACIEEDIQRD